MKNIGALPVWLDFYSELHELVFVCEDPRFNKDIDKKTGYRTKNILSMPILDNEGAVVGVAQIVNKMSSDYTSFTAADEEVNANSTVPNFLRNFHIM